MNARSFIIPQYDRLLAESSLEGNPYGVGRGVRPGLDQRMRLDAMKAAIGHRRAMHRVRSALEGIEHRRRQAESAAAAQLDSARRKEAEAADLDLQASVAEEMVVE